MLRRQRTTLALLHEAGQPVSGTQLFKLMFLLGEETFLGKNGVFYEFLPHKYGPYSFALNRELEALVAYGYVKEERTGTTASYTITSLGSKEQRSVDSDTSRAVKVVFTKFGKLRVQSLLRDVYSRYPWYSIRSELKDLIPKNAPKQRVAPAAIYTIGYEDRSVDGLFNKLLRVGICAIIDVRSNPISRKYGFARKSLDTISGKLGVTYEHWPQLGIASEKRRGVETSSEFKQLFAYYDRVILPKRGDDITRLAEQIRQTPSVLVCMEKEAQNCHRSRLAKVLSATSGLNVIDL